MGKLGENTSTNSHTVDAFEHSAYLQTDTEPHTQLAFTQRPLLESGGKTNCRTTTIERAHKKPHRDHDFIFDMIFQCLPAIPDT